MKNYIFVFSLIVISQISLAQTPQELKFNSLDIKFKFSYPFELKTAKKSEHQLSVGFQVFPEAFIQDRPRDEFDVSFRSGVPVNGDSDCVIYRDKVDDIPSTQILSKSDKGHSEWTLKFISKVAKVKAQENPPTLLGDIKRLVNEYEENFELKDSSGNVLYMRCESYCAPIKILPTKHDSCLRHLSRNTMTVLQSIGISNRSDFKILDKPQKMNPSGKEAAEKAPSQKN